MHVTSPEAATESAARETPGPRRALMMMALPAVLLTLLIVGFVVSRGGVVEERALRAALPYLITVNHAAVLAVLILVLRLEGRTAGDVGWRWDRVAGSRGIAIVVGLGCGLGLYLFKELGLDPVEALLAGNRPTFTTLFSFHWPGEELPLLLVATTLVAVEELVYRGYGLAALDARWPRVRAVAAMALLFGLLHWGNGPLAVVFTGILGVGFAALFLWRRSLLIPVVAHASYNALVILT